MAFTEVGKVVNSASVTGELSDGPMASTSDTEPLADVVTSHVWDYVNRSASTLSEISTELMTQMITEASDVLLTNDSSSLTHSSSSTSFHTTVQPLYVNNITTSEVTSTVTSSSTKRHPLLNDVTPTPGLPHDIMGEDGLEVLRTHWKIIVVACSMFVLATLIVLAYVIHKRRRYNIVEEEEEVVPYDYIYKPVQGNYIDEMYENTFVGVSIPLLQDVTKV